MIIKPDTSTESMVLSGHILRIKTQGGKIRVHEVCDEEGYNCSSATDIYNTITNWGWNGISAGWETWHYCFLNEDLKLKCSNDALETIIRDLIWTTPWGTRQPNLVDQDGYVTAPTANNRNMVRKTNDQWVPGWRNDESSNANNAVITIKQWWIEKWYFSVDTDTDKTIELDAWEWISISWQPLKRCRYICVATINGQEYTIWNSNSRINVDPEIKARLDEIAANLENWDIPEEVTCSISCTANAPTSQTNTVTVGWDEWKICTKVSNTEISCHISEDNIWWSTYIYNWSSLWTGITIPSWIWSSTHSAITPVWNKQYLYFTGNTTIYHKSNLKFQVHWLSSTYSPVLFHANGAKFGNAQYARTLNTPWVSIYWQLLVWSTQSDNYIYMYASWSHGDDDQHYEIKASKELAIGTNSWAFIYFQNLDGNTNYEQYRIWVNTTTPMATLDVKWTIRIDTNGNVCAQYTCNKNNEWTIIFRNHKFLWCVYKNSSYWRYEITTSNTAETPTWNINCNTASATNQVEM